MITFLVLVLITILVTLRSRANSEEVARSRSMSTLTNSMKNVLEKVIPGKLSLKFAQLKASTLWHAFVVKLKIMTCFAQILGQIDQVYSIPFPPEFISFLARFNFLSLDFMKMANFGCIANMTYYSRMIVATVVPQLVLLVFAGIYFRSNQPDVRSACIEFSLLFTYIIFPSTSTTIFKIYPCLEVDDGSRWLKADYSISCDAPDRAGMLVYTAYAAIIFPIGITTLYGYLLWTNRHTICPSTGPWVKIRNVDIWPPMEQSTKEEDDLIETRGENTKEIKQIQFLFREYEPRYYWFEFFECIRRLLLTGGTVLFLEGSSTQIVLGMLVALLSIQVYARTQPFLEDSDDVLAMTAQWAVFFTLFGGLLFKLRVSEADGYGSGLYVALMILVNVLVVVIACSSTFYSCWVALHQNESTSQSQPWKKDEKHNTAEHHVHKNPMVPTQREQDQSPQAQI
jgi:hypothetical protein